MDNNQISTYTKLILAISIGIGVAELSAATVRGICIADSIVANIAMHEAFPIQRADIANLLPGEERSRLVNVPFETPPNEYSLRWQSVDERCYADFTSQFGTEPGVSPVDRVQIGCLLGNRKEAVNKARKWVRHFSRSTAKRIMVPSSSTKSWEQTFKLEGQSNARALEVRIVKEEKSWAAVIVIHDRYPPTYVY